MTKLKKTLAVLLAMAMLCGFAALGVSAAEPATLTDAQMAELRGYLRTNLPLAAMEQVLARVPRWLNWAVFSNGSSYAAMQAELQAELKKAGVDVDKLLDTLFAGDILDHGKDVLTANKALADKYPGIMKKHGAFYIGWILDCMIWTNGLAGRLPLFA